MPTKVHFENIKEIIINEINTTKCSIDIAVAWITEPSIIKSLIELLNDKITVRILSFDDKINSLENFKKLYYSGAEIRLSKKLMHNKFCIIDNKTIISGSFNWTRKASFNNENITVIKEDNQLVLDFRKEFDKLWVKCKIIDSKLKINKEFIKEVEIEFQSHLETIKYNKFPFFYYVKENLENINFRYEHAYGNRYHLKAIKEGYYLIKNIDEGSKSLRYIFYAEKGLNIRELKKNSNINLELVSERFSEIYPNKFNRITEVKGNVWASREHKHSGEHERLYKITASGEIIDNDIRIFGSLKDNKKIILDIDGYKILNKNGQIIDFLENQKVKHDAISLKYHYFYPKVLTDEYFLAGTMIDENNYSSFRLGIYSHIGYNFTRPIFTDSSFDTIEDKNQFIFKEYPVAYHNPGDPYVKHLDNKNDKINAFKEHKLDATERRLYSSKWKIQEVKSDIVNKFNFTDKTALYFASDKEFGVFVAAMSILKFNLKVKDFNDAYKKYYGKIEFIEADNEKLVVAKLIISEYIEKYSKEKQAEKERIQKEKIKLKSEQKKDNCYIATCVYGDLNHPNTIEFRKFRDKFLNHFLFGRLFVTFYYLVSPKFVRLINNKPKLKKISKYIIEKIRLNIVKKITKSIL